MKNYLVCLIEKSGSQAGCLVWSVNEDYSKSKVSKYDTKDNDSIRTLRALNLVNAHIKKDRTIEGNQFGDISRYPKYNANTNTLVNNSILVICRTLFDSKKGFFIVNYKGESTFATEEQTINYVEKIKKEFPNSPGIANGQIKVSSSGKKFIQAISGNYETIEKISILEENKYKPAAAENDNELVPIWYLGDDRKSIEQHIQAIKTQPNRLEGEVDLQQMDRFIKSKLPADSDILLESGDILEIIKKTIAAFQDYQDLFNHSKYKFSQFKEHLKLISAEFKNNPKGLIEQVKALGNNEIELEDLITTMED